MRVFRHLERVASRFPRVVLTLGNFDGVHLGHQAIVQRTVAEARALGGQAVVMTFHPHPIAVVAPDRTPPLLQTLRDRLAALRSLGPDLCVVQRFTPGFARLAPAAFVEEVLLRRLELAHVVVGYDVTFGRDRSGGIDTLRALGQVHGFTVDAVGPVVVDAFTVSSSAIRRLLRAGDVGEAARLLGRPHVLRGRVVPGASRGRVLGFPTANVHCRAGVLLPLDGVYAVRVRLDDRWWAAVLNVGIRPTFDARQRTAEVHVLDWQGDLYGRWLEVALVERLRGEMRFPGPEALRMAIATDVERAREILGEGQPGPRIR
jgi:riboflavin kinase/FMN adenylyltransferase